MEPKTLTKKSEAFMAIITRKSKSGTKYQVKLRGQDGRWVTETFLTQRDAKEFEVQQKQNKFKGVPLANKGKNTTLDYFWNTWFTTSNQSTEGWKYSQRQMYRDYIQPHIGSLSLNQIKSPHISDILSKMEKLGRSEQTRKHVYNLLHKLFQDCVDDYEYISLNPVKEKFIPKVLVRESEYLDFEEVKKLLVLVRGKTYGLGIWIQLYTGLRIGEVCYLKWEHIDFLNSKIRIRGTYRKKERRMVNLPKGKEWHTMRLPKELMAYLTEEKSKSKSEWVQPSEKYLKEHLNFKTYGDYLKRYISEAGVNPRITSHCLRHSTHSIHMKFGATEDDMQMVFAHQSPTTTRRYIHGGHQPEERLDRIMDSVDVFGGSEAG
jgi:integrase